MLSRKTEPRFVPMTASQSSGFIRRSSVSRVMPALLTRMVTAPSRDSISETAASQAAPSATSRAMPRPFAPADFSESSIAAMPVGPVAVPMTVAPCAASAIAIARPMPRDAPVTSATSPVSDPVVMNLYSHLLPRARHRAFPASPLPGGPDRARLAPVARDPSGPCRARTRTDASRHLRSSRPR